MKVLRLLRLLRLTRVMRLPHVVTTLEAVVGRVFLQLLRLGGSMLLLLHWAACVWYFMADIQNDNENWLYYNGLTDAQNDVKVGALADSMPHCFSLIMEFCQCHCSRSPSINTGGCVLKQRHSADGWSSNPVCCLGVPVASTQQHKGLPVPMVHAEAKLALNFFFLGRACFAVHLSIVLECDHHRNGGLW